MPRPVDSGEAITVDFTVPVVFGVDPVLLLTSNFEMMLEIAIELRRVPLAEDTGGVSLDSMGGGVRGGSWGLLGFVGDGGALPLLRAESLTIGVQTEKQIVPKLGEHPAGVLVNLPTRGYLISMQQWPGGGSFRRSGSSSGMDRSNPS
jgi:hypothetical protein